MKKEVTWKDRCDMQMRAFVNSTMNIYGCTEEQAYEAVFKALCSTATYKLVDELLGEDDGQQEIPCMP